jgi:hypothetical protein
LFASEVEADCSKRQELKCNEAGADPLKKRRGFDTVPEKPIYRPRIPNRVGEHSIALALANVLKEFFSVHGASICHRSCKSSICVSAVDIANAPG